MGLKVSDLKEIEIFKNFKLIAGEKGLSRPIKATEILDFEFVQGAGIDRDQVFFGESIVLSSLLFAKDNPDMITDAVMRLDKMNVSCLAYKPIFIKELPEEAIEYANKNNFPIYEFGGDEFFEEIIFAVQKEIGEGADAVEKEIKLQEIIDRTMSTKEVSKFVKRLNPDFRRFVRAIYMTGDEFTSDRIYKVIKKFSHESRINRKAAICKYGDGCFIFLTQETDDTSRFTALLNDIFAVLGLDGSNMCCGLSYVLRTEGGFAKAVMEAYWSCVVAGFEGKSRKYYEEMGIYRFIVPEINSPSMREYMEEYLAPIIAENSELLQTAKAFVIARGSLEDTAAKLYCHKNTIRYRLTKIHDMIDPRSNDKEFFENLAIAIRLYMLIEKKEEQF